MMSAKSCPQCGGVLRYEDLPGSFPAGRHVAVELLFWATIVLLFVFFDAPPGGGKLYLALAAVAAAAWLALRPQQRAQAAALLERRQYCCAQCRQRFTGSALDEIASH